MEGAAGEEGLRRRVAEHLERVARDVPVVIEGDDAGTETGGAERRAEVV
jgi:hypothetical protein